MATSSYKLIFGLSVTHSYYKNNFCTCLQFIPCSGTAAVIKRYGFRLNQQADGFQLYLDAVSSPVSLFNHIENVTGASSFDFKICSMLSDFSVITNWPVNWKGQFQFNSSNSLNTIAGETFLLQQELQTAAATGGSLKLYFKDILGMYAAGVTKYSISFEARSTRWQYFIVNRSDVHFNKLTVKDKKGFVFEGQTEVPTPAGEKAFLFSSPQNLPLKQEPEYVFDLVNIQQSSNYNGSNIIYKGLPTPGTSLIETVVMNGRTEVLSPMYVYL